MSQAGESRLDVRVGQLHQDGRPYHYDSLTQDGRIRRIFGLTDEAPLPPVNDESLAVYHGYLTANLSMPFDALYCPTGGDMRQLVHHVHVIELMDPRQSRMHNLHGLSCKAQNSKELMELALADLGVRAECPNCQLIDDYAYWFVNWR